MNKKTQNMPNPQPTKAELEEFLTKMDTLSSEITQTWQHGETAVTLLEEMRQERDSSLNSSGTR
jgi:hypothetical protein